MVGESATRAQTECPDRVAAGHLFGKTARRLGARVIGVLRSGFVREVLLVSVGLGVLLIGLPEG